MIEVLRGRSDGGPDPVWAKRHRKVVAVKLRLGRDRHSCDPQFDSARPQIGFQIGTRDALAHWHTMEIGGPIPGITPAG
jgi:hypothetical protein